MHYFLEEKIPEDVLPVTLDGNTLPWVKQVQHLGHTLQSDNSMTSDINQKRRVFIGKINSLLQEFHYSDSNVLLKLAQTYACNVYGSNVWNLFSPTCSRLFTSYNVALRLILKLPRQTHRYMLEPLSEAPHLYVQLLSRYVTFVQSLLNCNIEVRFLASLSIHDMRTVMGTSMARLASLCMKADQVLDLSSKDVRQCVRYADIPTNEEWRIGIARDMKIFLDDKNESSLLSADEASDLLHFVCTS